MAGVIVVAGAAVERLGVSTSDNPFNMPASRPPDGFAGTGLAGVGAGAGLATDFGTGAGAGFGSGAGAGGVTSTGDFSSSASFGAGASCEICGAPLSSAVSVTRLTSMALRCGIGIGLTVR